MSKQLEANIVNLPTELSQEIFSLTLAAIDIRHGVRLRYVNKFFRDAVDNAMCKEKFFVRLTRRRRVRPPRALKSEYLLPRLNRENRTTVPSRLIHDTLDLIVDIQENHVSSDTQAQFDQHIYLEALSKWFVDQLQVEVLLYFIKPSRKPRLHSVILADWAQDKILGEWTDDQKNLAALVAAASTGDLQMMKYLIESTTFSNPSQCFGCPLTTAIRKSQTASVKLLVDSVDLHCVFNFESAILHACHIGDQPTTELLLNLTNSSTTYISALHTAAFKGCITGRRPELFTHLLTTIFHTTTPFTKSLFHAAARSNFHPFIPLSLASGFDININFRSGYTRHPDVIRCASRHGSTDFLSLLLTSGIRRGFRDDCDFLSRALCVAAEFGQDKIIPILLDAGADINYHTETHYVGHPSLSVTQYTPLEAACLKVELSTARLLLARGADVNAHKRGNQILSDVCNKGELEIVRALLEAGVSPDPPFPLPKRRWPRAYMPLLRALAGRHNMVANLLLEFGALDLRPRVFGEGSKEVRALE
ncbi:Ankyrin repeat-containing protein [Glarea lozoyensis ATCC 20868]|uniref:Ankyrin repeat-containing protein n=1 Tax=Glarea lozoyensis (strain ATCC 20868 / MF5171) TaxID=1116229 RepID=S3CUS8_GLAL2|nr:Ankyrin repeat-containing protein [Glarea lozoyensis ATCC 20868]EPE30157.1 Ankyrin repeat-containing protein [Glarea lozoyensis ATCC 20868]